MLNSPLLIVPLFDLRRFSSSLSRVDFPAPLTPTMAILSLWSMRVVKFFMRVYIGEHVAKIGI